jgi:Flp pilus assembly pilin Flp
MMTRHRRDARGASVIEYVLLLAMVALVVFATVYALGRSPDRPASVLGETFTSGPPVGGPGPTGPPVSSTSTSTSTTTTALLPPPPP